MEEPQKSLMAAGYGDNSPKLIEYLREEAKKLPSSAAKSASISVVVAVSLCVWSGFGG